ncbi:conserved hypothetical protein, partial [delta proteobacterium NaphS2]
MGRAHYVRFFSYAASIPSIEEYNEQKAWEHAELDHCPFHPEGGCDLARHGTYPRKFPEYCLVPRWYCPSAHKTISLL